MIEFYFNTAKTMLLVEYLKTANVVRLDQLERGKIIMFDLKIKEQFPEVHAELCEIVGGVGCEYGRVYQFIACNFSERDGHPDIDDDGNFILERVSCPIRHTCKRITCKAKASGNLSEREIEVICLFVKGFSEIEISERLFISKSTVHNHTTNIYSKLGFTGTSNPDRLLVAYAFKNKLDKLI